MSRLSPLSLERLTEEQQSFWDAINRGPRAQAGKVGLVGPFGVWARSPKIGTAVQALGAVARYGTSLPDSVREVAICTVGAHYRAKFEFAAHAAFARDAGVEPAALEAIRRGREPAFTRVKDTLSYQVATELLQQHRLGERTFQSARAALGESLLIELVSVIGYYCLVSLTLNAFEVPVAEGMDDPFPG